MALYFLDMGLDSYRTCATFNLGIIDQHKFVVVEWQTKTGHDAGFSQGILCVVAVNACFWNLSGHDAEF